MKFPIIEDIEQSKEMTTYFAGLVKKLSCQEGSFFDMKNMTAEHFPLLSPRDRRGINKKFTDLQAIIDKDDLVWIDNDKLFINNEEKTDVTLDPQYAGQKRVIGKMGGYIIIFPDKIWYKATMKNGTLKEEHGNIEDSVSVTATSTDKIGFQMVDADGDDITVIGDSATPKDGDYKINTTNGKRTLQVYSKTTGMWMNVASTYFKIYWKKPSTLPSFKEGDGLKVTVSFSDTISSTAKKNLNWETTFPNKEEAKRTRSNNFVISDCGTFKKDSVDYYYITVTGILGNASFEMSTPTVTVERKAPDISHFCECQNRLWACSKDGHEVYCCKQGDPTNWNCFAGVATDSWAATVGSDGKFTGAFNYLGYPIFFKENSLLKISVSGHGAHGYKEIECRGVQEGSEKSLVMLNESLFYKSSTNICHYDGNFPTEIGDDLGEGGYSDAVGGSIDNRYYVSMKDKTGKYGIYVYDINTTLWTKEDDTKVDFYVRHGDELFFVSNNTLYSTFGSHIYDATEAEGPVDWSVESGWIGYSSDGKKYLSRMDIRAKLDIGSHISLYMEYDSSGVWEYVWNVSGKGTKTFAVPVRPKRCDHFRYKLVGHGDAKLYSISKYFEEGSDL